MKIMVNGRMKGCEQALEVLFLITFLKWMESFPLGLKKSILYNTSFFTKETFVLETGE